MAREKHPKPVHQMTVKQFDALFKSEDDCIRYLVVRRWPQGVRLPSLRQSRAYRIEGQSLALAVLPMRARDQLSFLALDRHNL